MKQRSIVDHSIGRKAGTRCWPALLLSPQHHQAVQPWNATGIQRTAINQGSNRSQPMQIMNLKDPIPRILLAGQNRGVATLDSVHMRTMLCKRMQRAVITHAVGTVDQVTHAVPSSMNLPEPVMLTLDSCESHLVMADHTARGMPTPSLAASGSLELTPFDHLFTRYVGKCLHGTYNMAICSILPVRLANTSC